MAYLRIGQRLHFNSLVRNYQILQNPASCRKMKIITQVIEFYIRVQQERSACIALRKVAIEMLDGDGEDANSCMSVIIEPLQPK